MLIAAGLGSEDLVEPDTMVKSNVANDNKLLGCVFLHSVLLSGDSFWMVPGAMFLWLFH